MLVLSNYQTNNVGIPQTGTASFVIVTSASPKSFHSSKDCHWRLMARLAVIF